MIFVPKAGHVLVVLDSDEDRSATGILFPDERRRKRTTARVLIHNASSWWLCAEERLELNTHVCVEKWAWKQLTLASQTLHLIPEGAVLGIIDEGENDMTGNDLLSELHDRIKSQIESIVGVKNMDNDLKEATLESLISDMDLDVEDAVDELQTAEAEDVEAEDDK